MIERSRPLRRLVEDNAVVLVQNGRILKDKMVRNMVDEEDLQTTARKYGLSDYKAFETVMLEGDGSLSGVVKPEYREAAARGSSKLRE